MATFEKPKPSQDVPVDLLPLIRTSEVLTDRQFAEVRGKILKGDYPSDSKSLAAKLVEDKVLTEYQSERLLNNKGYGFKVGRYVIQDRLGSGSMGRVYLAHHQMMDRQVALKVIAPEIVSNEKVVSRFQREMRLVARLDHPNVIRAFDADQINNRVLYIVMEYVQGQSLALRLKKGPIPPAEMVDYAVQAALGLAHAHAQGIVHRDIKPSNLLLTREGQIKVLDLGLGVLMEADTSTTFATADGIAVGTVDYMSPEQACGREVDGRSDLYSLGCSMYHLMTGKLPFTATSPIERMGMRISGKPVPITEVKPDLPPGLVRVIDKLLASKPQDRYQSATEAATALQSLLKPKSKGAAVSPRVPAPAPAPLPEKVAEKIVPEYPKWFRPLANLAATKPAVAATVLIALLTVTFGLGFLMGWTLH